MQCGPVRFRTSAKREARRRPFAHRAILRPTGFRMPERRDGEGPTIHEIHAALAADDRRNELIVGEVAQALEAGRSPILLTEQKDHARLLADRLDRFTPHVLLLLGGMGTKRHRGSGDGSRTSPRPGSGY